MTTPHPAPPPAAAAAAAGAAARCRRSDELRAHKQLVRQIAGRLRSRLPAHVEMDELVQAGLIGLNEALHRFEDGRGSTFETYAARRIEGAMLDSLREADTVSRGTRARIREVQAAVQRLEHRLGRTPRAKEVANELGWSLELFHRTMVEAGAGGARTSDEALEVADEFEPEEHAVVDEHADPLHFLQQRQRHAALNAAFDALEEVERFVLESLYSGDSTLRDVGQVLGVSESRVSQISAAVVAKLRRRLRDW